MPIIPAIHDVTHRPQGLTYRDLDGRRGLYLFHLESRYHHAGHYLGYADDIGRRCREHERGGSKASPLLQAAHRAGCALAVVRVFDGGDRTTERRLKRGGGLSRHCPLCRERGTYHA